MPPHPIPQTPSLTNPEPIAPQQVWQHLSEAQRQTVRQTLIQIIREFQQLTSVYQTEEETIDELSSEHQ
jgi:hypothetical protein